MEFNKQKGFLPLLSFPTTQVKSIRQHVKLWSVIVAPILLLLTLFTFNALLQVQEQETSEVLQATITDIDRESLALTTSLQAIELLVDQLASDLESGALSLTDLSMRLEKDLTQSQWMYGLGLALEHNQLADQQGLWSRYFVKKASGRVQQTAIGYDYTEFAHTWYRKPLLTGKYWNEPYFGTSSNTLVTEYGVPIWLPGKVKGVDEPSGVLFGNISLHKLKKLLHLDNQHISYFFLLSREGRYITHPDEQLAFSGTTVFEHADSLNDPVLNSVAIKALNGERGYVSHFDPVTEQASLILYQPLDGFGWSVVVVVDTLRLLNASEMRQHWFLFIGLATLTLVLLSTFICLYRQIRTRNIIYLAIGVAVMFLLAIVSFWKINEVFPMDAFSSPSEFNVVNNHVLNNFKNTERAKAQQLQLAPPKFIDTGMYLQSIEFEGANNIKISGYVWQKYKKGQHKGVTRGIVLPEAENPSISEAYREFEDPNDPDCALDKIQARDCEELVGWYVFATFRQEFDYSFYPLDAQQVWLRVWHQDFQKNVILVPDLAAYSYINPKLTPGIQNNFVLPGWSIKESWFSINMKYFNTNLGNSDIHNTNNKPELLYNVDIKRNFMEPFVSRIIPVLVIFILLFLSLIICTKTGTMVQWFGFSASSVVLGLSALFFVVGMSHSELRRLLPSANIMYFEFFYFISYIMILYVSVNSIIIAKREPIIGQEENYLSKALYWPTLSFILFVLTFWEFY